MTADYNCRQVFGQQLSKLSKGELPMPPIRWGLTEGAYRKWAFIFDKDLPAEIIVKKGAISQASYIRDVIRYAAENNLKGGDWLKAVQVTATSETTIAITKKAKIGIQNIPSLSPMELLTYFNEGKLTNGFKFFFPEGQDEMAQIAISLGINFVHKGANVMEIFSQGED
ncbi:MAG: hypothetical protein RBR82_06380 [Pseudomonas sp.]|nr:hypothetical protein [Pseudomonas sp.]